MSSLRMPRQTLDQADALEQVVDIINSSLR